MYIRQNFENGTELHDYHLNNIENGIISNESQIEELKNITNNYIHQLNNLNVLCLGDSITVGQGLSDNTNTRWNAVLAKKYNWNLTVSAAGGISLSRYWYTEKKSSDQSICKKAEILKTMPTKPDIVILWGGHNDQGYRYTPLGSWDDLATEDTSGALATYADKDSFKGALRYVAELTHRYAPGALLFVLTPEWMSLKNGKLKVPADTTDTYRDFDAAIFEGANYFGWIPINMRACGITPFNLGTYTSDKVHPNAAGTTLIVSYLEQELSKYKIFPKLGEIKVTGININKPNTNIKVGETEQLYAFLTPTNASNQSLIWTSSDTSIATVNSNGLVSAIKQGSTIITVVSKSGNFKETCTINCVETNVIPEDLILNPNSYECKQSTSFYIVPNFIPNDSTNQSLTWTSSDTNVATINNGKVNALREGNVTITATTENGISSVCSLTVTV